MEFPSPARSKRRIYDATRKSSPKVVMRPARDMKFADCGGRTVSRESSKRSDSASAQGGKQGSKIRKGRGKQSGIRHPSNPPRQVLGIGSPVSDPCRVVCQEGSAGVPGAHAPPQCRQCRRCCKIHRALRRASRWQGRPARAFSERWKGAAATESGARKLENPMGADAGPRTGRGGGRTGARARRGAVAQLGAPPRLAHSTA